MKKKGLTLIEFVVVASLIAILATVLAPKLKNQLAKSRDIKAISILNSLRMQSEMYYSSIEKPPYDSSLIDEENALGILIEKLDPSGHKLFDQGSFGNKNGKWEKEEVDVPIGGHRINPGSKLIVFNGFIGFTFKNPSGVSSDGVELWFEPGLGVENYDTVGKRWTSY